MNFDFGVFCATKTSHLIQFWEYSAFQHMADGEEEDAAAADDDDALADRVEFGYKHQAADNYCNCSVYNVADYIRISSAVDRISNFFFCYDLKKSNFF